MSAATGAAPPIVVLGLGLDLTGPWHQRSTQAYLLGTPSSTAGEEGGGGRRGSRAPLRLPALVTTSKGAHRRSSIARLSISEPSLFTTNENVLFERFSSNRRPSVLQKGPPPPPPFSKSSIIHPCKTCLPARPSQAHQQQQQSLTCSRPAFIHFTKAIQPSSKPRPARRHSHNPTLGSEVVHDDLRSTRMKSHDGSSLDEPLSVVGKPCLLSCSERPTQVTVTAPSRTQLHVFLPTEAEGEEADSESVDEGFMDELDGKITTKIQQVAPKTLKL